MVPERELVRESAAALISYFVFIVCGNNMDHPSSGIVLSSDAVMTGIVFMYFDVTSLQHCCS